MNGPPVRPVVAVLPDVTGVDRIFSYAVPTELAPEVAVGTIVRVPLAGRNVRGWVLDTAVTPDPSLTLREVLAVVSRALSPALVDLARFGSWRYAGRLRPFLLAGSPPRIVRSLPRPAPPAPTSRALPVEGEVAVATRAGLALGRALLRLAPLGQRLGIVEEVVANVDGDVVVLVPAHRDAEVLGRRLLRLGHSVALVPGDWPDAAAGGRVVIGTRSAAFAPVGRLGALVVLDAHAESYVDERAPTWNAVVLAGERARAAAVPLVLVSPCPGPELLAAATLVTTSPGFERAGWPAVEVLDRREDDPRSGLYAPGLAEIIRRALAADPSRPVICVLNRRGRARLLACATCGTLARCEHCGAAVRQLERPAPGEATELTCPSCHRTRPLVCLSCHSSRLKTLRVGVRRAAEELAALTGADVELVTADAPRPAGAADAGRVLVGTEAVLHRVRQASVVVFLDIDQELLAPRLSAGQRALALLVRAGRLVGGRHESGPEGFTRRLVLQTRVPEDDVITAVVRGDPALFSAAEDARRQALGLPPYAALAVVSGEDAAELVAHLAAAPGIESGELDGLPGPSGESDTVTPTTPRFMVRASDAVTLCDALAATGLVGPGVRIEVDPVAI